MEISVKFRSQYNLIFTIVILIICTFLSFKYFMDISIIKIPIFETSQEEVIGKLIPASLKRVKDYPSELENKSLEEIIELSKGNGETALKAKKLKKLVEQQKRLKEKY